MKKEERMFAVTDRLAGNVKFKVFNESKNGGDFWTLFDEIVDTADSTVFLLKLKHAIDERVEDQVLYMLANAAGATPPSECTDEHCIEE